MSAEKSPATARRGYLILGIIFLMQGIGSSVLFARQLTAGETPYLAWAVYGSLGFAVAITCLYWFASTYGPKPLRTRKARIVLSVILVVGTALALLVGFWVIADQSLS